MIGMLLVTHDTVGEAILQAAAHVLNRRPPQVAVLPVLAHEDPLDLLPRACACVRQVDAGSGVLVLTDIYGASPSNLACKLLEPGRVEVVTGVNVPMLVRALTYRDRDLDTVVTKAVAGGRDGVMRVER